MLRQDWDNWLALTWKKKHCYTHPSLSFWSSWLYETGACIIASVGVTSISNNKTHFTIFKFWTVSFTGYNISHLFNLCFPFSSPPPGPFFSFPVSSPPAFLPFACLFFVCFVVKLSCFHNCNGQIQKTEMYSTPSILQVFPLPSSTVDSEPWRGWQSCPVYSGTLNSHLVSTA